MVLKVSGIDASRFTCADPDISLIYSPGGDDDVYIPRDEMDASDLISGELLQEQGQEGD